MRSGRWGGWGPLQYIGGDITGATVGIIGAGRIGAAMARKSRGFAMTVLYCDEYRNEALECETGASSSTSSSRSLTTSACTYRCYSKRDT